MHVAIARNVAGLIEDGAVLQTGVGGIPDAVLPFLSDRKDLGIHSELVSEGVIPLIENGVITGARKNFKPRKIIVGFALGTRRFFEFVDNNPIFEFHPTAYTNDPTLIARNDNMVAINSALQVDLTGQVCSDSIGNQFYSGIGGQVDFLRGASRSKGGKPIIAISSTAKSGTISRIVPMLSPGAGVVTSRGLVRYVVTEHGVAYLHGKSIRERARALIEIAEPTFRPELYEYCERTKWLQHPEVMQAVSR
jgi:acyl-CoA hydrolase